ncbi:MAG: NADH-quinone oxidoreductase subunit J [Geminicoccaceae bacterium]|nr:MAG: NADH-quinone oxidoreductase subunit J [Geminicoccaceae bacterium]
MTVALAVFYLLAGITIASGVMVISARNPVHSVLFMILAFFNSAGLFVLAGAEFLAMVLIVVYVGAVAVLFLFVVMMLDIDVVAMRQGFMKYLPVGALVGLVLLIELFLVFGTLRIADAPIAASVPTPEGVTNTEALGAVLYTEYFFAFQLAGIILLVAIIGAITLTLRDRGPIKRQNISEQVHRDRTKSVRMRRVEPGRGL